MTKLKPEVLEKLTDFIDTFEEEYGDIEGFEVRVEHGTTKFDDEVERNGYATVKELIVKRIKLEEFEI